VGHGGVYPRQGGVARGDGDGEMVQRIHILGASGSGTTTLGRALAERLQCPHFETDDYFWILTDPPYTHQRERTERQRLLMKDVTAHDSWVVSGSLCGWGDVAIPLFELVVVLAIPRDIRMEGRVPEPCG
jgi:adenylate kinase family enzyme